MAPVRAQNIHRPNTGPALFKILTTTWKFSLCPRQKHRHNTGTVTKQGPLLYRDHLDNHSCIHWSLYFQNRVLHTATDSFGVIVFVPTASKEPTPPPRVPLFCPVAPLSRGEIILIRKIDHHCLGLVATHVASLYPRRVPFPS